MKRLSSMTAADLAALPVGARFECDGGTSPYDLTKTGPDEWRMWDGEKLTSADVVTDALRTPLPLLDRWLLAPCPGCMGEPACTTEPCAWDLTTDNPPPAAKE